ncbi:MAG: amidohydrolase family protein [Proteobacteria bacterium]|nr:amidohydrolase family protein [Pseudomonadota bacterium]
MKSLLSLTMFLVSFAVYALTPVPAEKQAKRITYINANIHVGNGEVFENAMLSFVEGKIDQIGHSNTANSTEVVDLQGKHIYPGFILTNTDLGLIEISSVKATVDTAETGSLNPNVRSIIAYNTDSERIPAMRFNGILLAQTTPQGGLVSGTSSVVQLDAWNWQDAVVKQDDAVHVNWPAQWSKKFDFSTFTLELKKDEKYAEKINKVKDLFNDAKHSTDPDNLKLNSVKTTFTGAKKIYIHSNNPKAIIESITFFKSIGLENLVLVTAQAASLVIDFLKQSKIPVILTGVHGLPQKQDDSIDAAYQLPALLNQAGILTSLSYGGSMSSRNLAFTAGTTVAYGNTPEDALTMITLNPAKILGIDKNYGSLELGKSATFFISDGDALDMRGNIITAAYIDGRKIDLFGQQQELFERFKKKLSINQ